MSGDLLLTFNAGSSTVKIGLFSARQTRIVPEGRAMIDFRTNQPRFRIAKGPQTFEMELEAEDPGDLIAVMTETFSQLAERFDLSRIRAIGHRVVHGGDMFNGPVLLDEAVIQDIDALTNLAPLHQPQALRLIRAIHRLRPDLAQVASFDTAFHRCHADVVRRFAIPRALHDRGIKRYGFHGLSYKFIAEKLGRGVPELARGKVIAAHLGSGASLCGMENGVSRDSSMGFSALDGIPMATRCGTLDPGVLLHLMGGEGRSVKEVEDLLYRQCGLLGASGISADSRELLKSDQPEARQALDLFTFRIAGELSRIATTLGGLDAIIFTAGIGENQPWIRSEVCRRLMWLGVDLAPCANEKNAAVISSPASRVAVLVVATDEERVIADEILSCLNG
jgi:acetate kinase